jgi:prepilin-type N-terminal cleavage/methylation domain-containing protein
MCLSRIDRRPAQRHGLTLLELLLATAILSLVAATLAAVGRAVQMGSSYSEDRGLATQHARVCLERITRTVHAAQASEQFPGCAVFAETVGSWRFPDTLVVWRGGAVADPEGLPRISELVVYCPNPTTAHELVEIRVPSDGRTAPALDQAAAWQAELAAFKSHPQREQVVLTDRLRTAAPSNVNTPGSQRGAARFEVERRPAPDRWAQYRAGEEDWEDLAWVQGVYGDQAGLAQTWLRIELQLAVSAGVAGTADDQAVPFFGSAAVYYELPR